MFNRKGRQSLRPPRPFKKISNRAALKRIKKTDKNSNFIAFQDLCKINTFLFDYILTSYFNLTFPGLNSAFSSEFPDFLVFGLNTPHTVKDSTK